jgi:hypothetical protein
LEDSILKNKIFSKDSLISYTILFFFEKKFFTEDFSISENNIISVEAAKVTILDLRNF